jgi:outer membrane lipoprotein-sorting protein
MIMNRTTIFMACLTVCVVIALGTMAFAQDPEALVQAAFDYYRGKASVATVKMTIHRPDWERVSVMKAWTKGQEDGIFRITSPPKDAGNGTLKRGREMWTFNPKVNRVIKLPPSMMSQSWMGSDFSNNDLAKSDSLLKDYSHTLTGTETHEGKTVYIIKSMPNPDAPVVWGMQTLKIREDHIFLSEVFHDEDLKPVKIMTAHDIQMMGGKLFPKVWRMRKADVEDEYTELDYSELTFKEDLPDNLFTLSNLRNPRR